MRGAITTFGRLAQYTVSLSHAHKPVEPLATAVPTPCDLLHNTHVCVSAHQAHYPNSLPQNEHNYITSLDTHAPQQCMAVILIPAEPQSTHRKTGDSGDTGARGMWCMHAQGITQPHRHIVSPMKQRNRDGRPGRLRRRRTEPTNSTHAHLWKQVPHKHLRKHAQAHFTNSE